MKRFLAFWTLVYLWSVETLYHVLVGLCWFHQGPSFSDGCLLLFSSVYIRCQDGLSAPTVFFRRLLVIDGDRAAFAFTLSIACMTPSARTLITISILMQDL